MNNTKKALLVLAVLLIAVVGYNVSLTRGESVKIGATLALSGNLSFVGDAEKKGLELAVSEINENGGVLGKKLELIIEDNAGDAKQAVSGARKMVDVDGVDVLFSAFTHVTQQVKVVAAQAGIPMLYHASDATIAHENPLFFRDYFDAAQSGSKLGEIVASRGLKKVSFVTEINDGCTQLENALLSVAKDKGFTVVASERYKGTDTDFRSQLLKLKQANVPIIACSFRHEHILMKQMKELGMIQIPVFHYVAPFLPVADTAEMKQLFTENKSVSTWYKNIAEGSEKEKEFAQKFKDKYGVDSRPDSAYAYDDVYMIVNAIKKCGNTEAVCVSDTIRESSSDGASGHLSFDKDGVSSRPVYMMEAINGEWRALEQ